MLARAATLMSPTTGLAAQLKLLLEGQSVIQLTGGIFSGAGQLLHQFFRLHNLFQNFSLGRLAQHTTNEHLKQDQKALMQGKDQVKLAHYPSPEESKNHDCQKDASKQKSFHRFLLLTTVEIPIECLYK
jgi:hypothetical protein